MKINDVYLGELDLDPALEKQTESYYSKILSGIMQSSSNQSSKSIVDTQISNKTTIQPPSKIVQKEIPNKKKHATPKPQKHANKTTSKPKPLEPNITINETQQLIEQALKLLLNNTQFAEDISPPKEIYNEAKDYWDSLHPKNDSKTSQNNSTRNETNRNSSQNIIANHSNSSENSTLAKKPSIFQAVKPQTEKAKTPESELPSLFEMVSAEKPAPPPFTPSQLPKFTQVNNFFDDIDKFHAERNPVLDESSFVTRKTRNPPTFEVSPTPLPTLASQKENAEKARNASLAVNNTLQEESKMIEGLDKLSTLLQSYISNSDDDIQVLSNSFVDPPTSFSPQKPISNDEKIANSAPVEIVSPPVSNSIVLPFPKMLTNKPVNSPFPSIQTKEDTKSKEKASYLRIRREEEMPLIPHFFSFAK